MLPRARSAAESPEDVRRVAGERRSGLLLQMGGVGGQYVAQSLICIKYAIIRDLSKASVVPSSAPADA
jgi:hypothetical protein